MISPSTAPSTFGEPNAVPQWLCSLTGPHIQAKALDITRNLPLQAQVMIVYKNSMLPEAAL